MAKVETLWVVVLMWPFAAIHVQGQAILPSLPDRSNLLNRIKVLEDLFEKIKLGRLNISEMSNTLRPSVNNIKALNASLPSPTLPKVPSPDNLSQSPEVPSSVPSLRGLMLATGIDSTMPPKEVSQVGSSPSSKSDNATPPHKSLANGTTPTSSPGTADASSTDEDMFDQAAPGASSSFTASDELEASSASENDPLAEASLRF